MHTDQVLWQPLDQCPMTAQTINLTGGIFSGEHELYNSQENSTENHNSILPTIYRMIDFISFLFLHRRQSWIE